MPMGTTKVRTTAVRLRRKRRKPLRSRVRIARMLFAEFSAGEMKEERLERGALVGEEPRRETRGFGERIKFREGEAGWRAETMGVAVGREWAASGEFFGEPLGFRLGRKIYFL